MNTIQEALESGRGCTHLGPVYVEKVYPRSSAKAPLTLLIKDDSKKTLIKLWGNSAKLNIDEGDNIILRALGDDGLISPKEDDQGKMLLNANGVTVEVVGSGNAAAARYTARNRSAGTGAPSRGSSAAGGGAGRSSASMKKLIDFGLKCVNYARKCGETDGAVLAAIFGSAMYGFKEGRRLVDPEESGAEKTPPPPPPDPEPTQPEPPVTDDFEEDDIPF